MAAAPNLPEHVPRGRIPPPAQWTLILLLFIAAAVAATWPLASDLGAGLPLGSERVATVPLFNLWTLAWNVESVGHGYANYWQAPIFHPTADAFALSEPQPVLGLLAAALSAAGLSTVQVYNLLLIAALTGNGLLMTLLLRRIGLGWTAAVAGGGLGLMLPFTHQELGVLQLVPLVGVLLFALAVLRFSESPGVAAGSALGGALALAYGLSSQVAAFAALAFTPVALWLWWPLRRRRGAWTGLAAGVALFFALVSPLVIAQVRATSAEDFVRAEETVRKHSARPGHYVKTAWPQLIPTPGVEPAKRPSSRAFWPGTVRVLLAVLAAVAAWRSRRWRRIGVAGLLLLTASVLLSFGGHLAWGSVTLPKVLGLLPGLGQIRSFFRFALFAQLAVVALAAGGLHAVATAVGERVQPTPRPRQIFGQLPVLALCLVAVLELRPGGVEITELPPLDGDLPWLSWIEENTEPRDVLAFLPFPEGRSAGDYLTTSQWMYWQQRHWRPMVNGYSGFFPRPFKTIKKSMEDFPSAPTLQALYDVGVRYCVVPRSVINESPPPDPNGPIQLEPAFRDEEHELAIFALRKATETR